MKFLNYIILFLFFIFRASACPVEGDQRSSLDYNSLRPENTQLQKKSKDSLSSISFNDIRPRVALVLSGGGARGFAQVGILEELEKAGIRIDYIVGTSIGAVVGGLYACGYTAEELDSMVSRTDWNNILLYDYEKSRNDYFLDQKQIIDRNLITLNFNNFKIVYPEAISYATKFSSFLQEKIWDGIYQCNGNFNRLKYPFRAVTTDLVTGKPVALKSGNLPLAIRSSAAVPLRFTPVRMDSLMLVDGGLKANIPVESAMEFRPDIIIAVNTTSPLLKFEELDLPWNQADQMLSILMDEFSKASLSKADIVIEPELKNHKNTDFTNLQSLMASGRDAAREAIPVLREMISRKTDSLFNKKLIAAAGHGDIHVNFRGPNGSDSINYLAYKDSRLDKSTGGSMVSLLQSLPSCMEYEKFDLDIRHEDSIRIVNISARPFPVLKKILITGSNGNIIGSLNEELNNNYSGKRIDPAVYLNILDRILRVYHSAGYSHAEICSASFSPETGELKINAVTFKIGKINIVNNESTSDFLIFRELGFNTGDPVNTRRILEGWSNLQSCGLFNDVDIQLNSVPGDTTVNVDIRVKEKGSQSIGIGGRVDDERHAQLGFELIQENLFNFGTRVDVRLATGIRNEAYSVEIGNQRIMNTLFSFSVKGYYRWRNIYTYTPKAGLPRDEYENLRTGELRDQRFGLKALLGSQIQRKGLFSVEYRLEKQRLYNLEFEYRPEFQVINTIKVGTLFDTEDKSDFPSEGRLLDMSLETSLFNIKHSVSYSKVVVYYRSDYSFGSSTIRPSVMFGFADGTLPATEFFGFGGQDVFYGMREDEQRGRQIAISSLEYRRKLPFSIFFDTYLSLRYDLGSVWEQPDMIVLRNLRHGIGGAIAFDTPLGPAKFSIGRSFYFMRSPAGAVWGPVMGYFSVGLNF